MIAALLPALLSLTVQAQKRLKPWAEWSQKEAQKILNDSPWGQTQTETDTSQMFFSPTNDTGVTRSTSNSASRNQQGATNQAVYVNFHVRFFTAKPVRQALVRLIEFNQTNLPKDTIERVNQFANLQSNEWIIVAVAFDASDQRYAGPVMQAFGSATTDLAKNNTYLERSDGQRLFLIDYRAPAADGLGARFVFPRIFSEGSFLSAKDHEVRFHSEVGPNVKLDRRFKVSDMVYEGKLEY